MHGGVGSDVQCAWLPHGQRVYGVDTTPTSSLCCVAVAVGDSVWICLRQVRARKVRRGCGKARQAVGRSVSERDCWWPCCALGYACCCVYHSAHTSPCDIRVLVLRLRDALYCVLRAPTWIIVTELSREMCSPALRFGSSVRRRLQYQAP